MNDRVCGSFADFDVDFDKVQGIILEDRSIIYEPRGFDKCTLIMYAARNGKLEVVKFIVGLDILTLKQADENGYTALIEAATYGHLEIVKFIVGRDISTLAQTDKWCKSTALAYAAKYGHLEIVKFIVGLDITTVPQTYECGKTALIKAAGGGHMEIVKFIVGFDISTVTQVDDFGRIALIEAARGGHLEIVKFLANLDRATVRQADGSGHTALIWAAEIGHLEIVKFILGVDIATVTQADIWGKTAFFRAARGGYLAIVNLIGSIDRTMATLADVYGDTALIVAAKGGHLEVVKFLVNLDRATVGHANDRGQTAFWGASGGHLEVVEFIAGLDKATVKQADNWGYTPLIHAARRGHLGIVKIIVSLDITTVTKADDYEGSTALISAAQGGHLEVVEFIAGLDRATMTQADNHSRTALFWAADKLKIRVVEFLIENGSDPSKQTNDGHTALHIAVRKCPISVVHGPSLMSQAKYRTNLIRLLLNYSWNKMFGPTRRAFEESLRQVVNIRQTHAVAVEYLKSCMEFVRAGAILSRHEMRFEHLTDVKFFCNTPGKAELLECFVCIACELRRSSFFNLNEFLLRTIEGSEQDQLLDNVASEILRQLRQKFPRRLQAICRIAVLQKLPFGIIARQQAISSLQLPKLLESYLNFDDLELKLSKLGNSISYVDENDNDYDNTY